MFQLPSSIQKIDLGPLADRGVQLWVKRDDLIHRHISGNKWRKLKYNFLEAKEKGHSPIVSFGGAFSNHLAALAAGGKEFGIDTVGIVRGEEADLNNPTLAFAMKMGMEIRRVSRSDYRNTEKLASKILEEFPKALVIPEGGANVSGVKGCMEILQEVDQDFDLIACACGTGTTLAGLTLSVDKDQRVIGFPVMKQGVQLVERTDALMDEAIGSGVERRHQHLFELVTQFHFGGFGKVNDELITFMQKFTEINNFQLDPIYTGKMFFGLWKMIDQGHFSQDAKILAIHSGGLQGIQGFEFRTGKMVYPGK